MPLLDQKQSHGRPFFISMDEFVLKIVLQLHSPDLLHTCISFINYKLAHLHRRSLCVKIQTGIENMHKSFILYISFSKFCLEDN